MKIKILLRSIVFLCAMIITFACSEREKKLVDVLKVEVDSPETVAIGHLVPLKVRVTNISSEPVEVWDSIPYWDFVIKSGDEIEVWRWSKDKLWQLFGPVPDTLQRGSPSRECHWDWDQRDNTGVPVRAGVYFFIGEFKASKAEDLYVSEVLKSKPHKLTISANGDRPESIQFACDTKRNQKPTPTPAR